MFNNVFEAIRRVGHDEDFEGVATPEFQPTQAKGGSWEKIQVLRYRVERGWPLWHPDDSKECDRARGARMPSDYVLQVVRVGRRKGLSGDD